MVNTWVSPVESCSARMPDADTYSEQVAISDENAKPSRASPDLEWIDPSIEFALRQNDGAAAGRIVDVIAELCQHRPTMTQGATIIDGILSGNHHAYANMLDAACSNAITQLTPRQAREPYHRFLTAFQNSMGNDAYLTAILADDKRSMFCLSKIKNLPLDAPNHVGTTPLLAASRMGKPYEVKRILRSGNIDLERRDHRGRTAMHLAAQHSACLKLVQHLLKTGAFDLGSQDAAGNTPLHSAYHYSLSNIQESSTIHDGQVSSTSQSSIKADTALEVLISSSSAREQNVGNGQGNTILHLACQNLDHHIIDFVLAQHQIDVTIENRQGRTALEVLYSLDPAPDRSHQFASSLAAFINNGVAVDSVIAVKSSQISVLHLLCQTRKDGALAVLVEVPGVDVNIKDAGGHTPLQVAFEVDHGSIGKFTNLFLVNASTNLSVPLNADGDTILHVACRSGSISTIEKLVKHKRAPLNVSNFDGVVPLQVAYHEFAPSLDSQRLGAGNPRAVAVRSRMLDLLLSHPNTDVNAVDHEGQALIHVACDLADYATIAKLLNLTRTNVNMEGRGRRSPLRIAFDKEQLRLIKPPNGNRSVVKLLVQNERVFTDLRIGSEGHSLLHRACDDKNIDAIQLLLDNPNTDVNSVDFRKRSALWIAHARDHDDGSADVIVPNGLVALLLQCDGIDANSPVNANADTLLHVACSSGQIPAIRALLGHPRINVNVENGAKRTPLQCAYQFDYNAAVPRAKRGKPSSANHNSFRVTQELLLRNDHLQCNVPLDQHDNTILHLLSQIRTSDPNKSQMISKLMGCVLSCPDIDPNAKNIFDETPLQNAFATEGFSRLNAFDRSVLRHLLEHEQTDPNVPMGQHQGTLLHVACVEKNVPAVELLLTHPNVDPMCQDSQGQTVVQIAAELAHDAETKDTDSQAILHMVFTFGMGHFNELGQAHICDVLKQIGELHNK